MEQVNPVAVLAEMVVGSAATLALLSSNRAIPSTGTVTAVGVGIYSDADCTIKPDVYRLGAAFTQRAEEPEPHLFQSLP